MFSHAQAPVRIGIAGGGTDLPAWAHDRVGQCLSLAIASYTHAVAITRPDGGVVASYRKRDVDRSATEIANGLIRESALLHGWECGFEVHTLSELSSRGSGLGVSSSIAVALAACFKKMALLRDGPEVEYQDFRYAALADGPSRIVAKGDAFATERDPNYFTSIAQDAWTVEIDRLRRPIGRQDHMAAAHGGLRLYKFWGHNAVVERSFSQKDADWVARHLALVQLPEGHDSRAILSGVKSTEALEKAAEAVPIAVNAIECRSAHLLGAALTKGQQSKREIRGATPPWIAEILEKLKRVAGVYGCKVAGAGGGGHIVVACEPGSTGAIERATNLPAVGVAADYNGVRSEGWL
jgi:D-glycero-alpha-D-manno-heptose-7-phosphate kinase